MGARAAIGGPVPGTTATGDRLVQGEPGFRATPGGMGNLFARAIAVGRAAVATRKPKPGVGLVEAPTMTPEKQSADVAAANRARDRVRSAGTVIGGSY